MKGIRASLSFSDYWHVIRAKWNMILATILIGVTLGGLASLFVKPQYESTSLFLVTVVGATNLEEANYSYSILGEAMQTIPEAVSTSTVLIPAAQRAHLPTSFSTLQKSVQASRKANTFTVEVTAKGENGPASADLANAVVVRLGEILPSIIRFPASGQAKVELQQLTVATPPERPSSPSLILFLSAGLGAGALVGLTLAVATKANGPGSAQPTSEEI